MVYKTAVAVVAFTAMAVTGASAQNAAAPSGGATPALAGPIVPGPALETPSYDFVQQAASMTYDGSKLTLEGLAPATIFFSDRPYRMVGHIGNDKFANLWGTGQTFSADPPNAALSVLSSPDVPPAIVELTTASLDGSTLTYDVKVLSGTLPDQASEVALFVDHFHGGGAFHGPNGGGGFYHYGGGGFHPNHPYHPYGPYGPYHPYHPYGPYPYHPYYGPGWGGAAAAGAVGLATGAMIGAAAANNNSPTYVYPIPAGPIPSNCYLNGNHTQMICSVPLN